MPTLFNVPNGRKLSGIVGNGRTRILNSCGDRNGTCSKMKTLPMCVTDVEVGMTKGKGKKKGKMC